MAGEEKINESSAVIIRTNLYENQPTVLCEASRCPNHQFS